MPKPNTRDAMKRYRAGKAGFTDKAHLKAKGLIPRADGTKRKSPKYEDLDKDDVSTIKPIIKQLKKSVKSHDKQAKTLEKDIADEKDLEEQVEDLENQIAEAKKVKLEELKHPEKDEDRVKKDEWLVMLGVCTHLGCVPLSDKGEYNGWFCPCHGSHYDTSGRIRKGPAPTNMEIPKYEFVDSNTIKIG